MKDTSYFIRGRLLFSFGEAIGDKIELKRVEDTWVWLYVLKETDCAFSFLSFPLVC